MTPHQYRAAIAKLGLSQQGAAEFLHCSLRTSHGWANGAPVDDLAAEKLYLALRVGLDEAYKLTAPIK